MDAEVPYNEAVKYRDGKGEQLNRKVAAEYFKEAAKYDHPGGASWIALLYKGVITGYQEDYEQFQIWNNITIKLNALEFYLKRANEGDPDAQYSLGVLYEEAVGTELDYEQSLFWYKKAAKSGFAPAQNNCGLMYKRGFGVKMNDKKAAFWYKKAAKQGYVIAQNNLGYMYKEGKGVRVNTKKAYNWYHKAAQVGYASAQTNLAYLYRMGIGIDRDINAAFEWYKKAAEQGHSVAMNTLGIMYQNGDFCINVDHAEAFKWYKRASKENIAASQYNLFLMYHNKEVPGIENLTEEEISYVSMEYLKKSVFNKHPSALGMLMFGKKLKQGRGVLKNKTEGIKWLLRSAIGGREEAMEELEICKAGLISLLKFGILELDTATSNFPFVARGKAVVSTFVSQKKSSVVLEYLTEDPSNKKVKLILLKAFLESLFADNRKILLKLIQENSEVIIEFLLEFSQQIYNKSFYNAHFLTPPQSNPTSFSPFYEISYGKLASEIILFVLSNFGSPLLAPLPENQNDPMQLATLREDDSSFDISIILDNHPNPIRVHKHIITKFPFFNALLNNGMSESTTNLIHIHDVSFDIMEIIIDFIYGIDITPSLSGENLMELFVAARRFTLPELHHFLAVALQDILDWDQFKVVYENSIDLEDPSLRETCLIYSLNHLPSLFNLRSFDKNMVDLIVQFAVTKFKECVSAASQKECTYSDALGGFDILDF